MSSNLDITPVSASRLSVKNTPTPVESVFPKPIGKTSRKPSSKSGGGLQLKTDKVNLNLSEQTLQGMVPIAQEMFHMVRDYMQLAAQDRMDENRHARAMEAMRERGRQIIEQNKQSALSMKEFMSILDRNISDDVKIAAINAFCDLYGCRNQRHKAEADLDTEPEV